MDAIVLYFSGGPLDGASAKVMTRGIPQEIGLPNKNRDDGQRHWYVINAETLTGTYEYSELLEEPKET